MSVYERKFVHPDGRRIVVSPEGVTIVLSDGEEIHRKGYRAPLGEYFAELQSDGFVEAVEPEAAVRVLPSDFENWVAAWKEQAPSFDVNLLVDQCDPGIVGILLELLATQLEQRRKHSLLLANERDDFFEKISQYEQSLREVPPEVSLPPLLLALRDSRHELVRLVCWGFEMNRPWFDVPPKWDPPSWATKALLSCLAYPNPAGDVGRDKNVFPNVFAVSDVAVRIADTFVELYGTNEVEDVALVLRDGPALEAFVLARTIARRNCMLDSRLVDAIRERRKDTRFAEVVAWTYIELPDPAARPLLAGYLSHYLAADDDTPILEIARALIACDDVASVVAAVPKASEGSQCFLLRALADSGEDDEAPLREACRMVKDDSIAISARQEVTTALREREMYGMAAKYDKYLSERLASGPVRRA